MWDWASPAASEAGIEFDAGPSLASRTSRFDALCRFKGFVCPENDILSSAYYESDVKNLTTLMVSYDTALMFQDPYPEPNSLPAGAASGLDTFALGQSFINTGAYLPYVSDVGDPSVKIFIADGGRFCETDSSPPDYDLEYGGSGSPGGVYADYGPWSYYTRAYGHNDLGDSPSTKPITYSMRHGSRKPNAPVGAYRFNSAFFDGHVETLDGNHGLNPNLWIPTGQAFPRANARKTPSPPISPANPRWSSAIRVPDRVCRRGRHFSCGVACVGRPLTCFSELAEKRGVILGAVFEADGDIVEEIGHIQQRFAVFCESRDVTVFGEAQAQAVHGAEFIGGGGGVRIDALVIEMVLEVVFGRAGLYLRDVEAGGVAVNLRDVQEVKAVEDDGESVGN